MLTSKISAFGGICLLALALTSQKLSICAQDLAAPSLPTPVENPPTVVNAIPAFLSFWNAAQSRDELTQVRMFRQMVIRPHPELFKKEVVDLGQSRGSAEEDRQIAIYLTQVRPLIPTIRVLNDRLKNDQTKYVQGFTAVFPDYRPSTPVYFTVSLGRFDGGTREVNGRTALLFGVDLIAGEYGEKASLSVLFDHELFHQYHGAFALSDRDSDGQLWESLWEEGLATYVSWRMNPSADEDDVLLSKTLAGQARPLSPTLAADMLRHMQSKDPGDYDRFFLGNSKDGKMPARSGYFLGYLIASRLGQSSTPLGLAHLHGEELRTRIEQALEDLVVPAFSGTPE